MLWFPTKRILDIFCVLENSRESLKITEASIFRTEWYIKDDITQWFSDFVMYWNHRGISQMPEYQSN